MGGFGSARNCVLREGSRDRDNPVSASVQTVHTNCTLVRLKNQNTMALDWARVGGVVHEVWGECKTDENIWKPKYEPNLDKLPVWRHPRFKPGCSRKQEKIYFEKIYFEDNRDTISSLYRQEYLQTEGEEETNRRGRRLSGRVGEEVRRLEEGVGVGGVGMEVGGEKLACKSRTEDGKEVRKQSRIVRRGGRVSNILKTLEQGARQANKINKYFSTSGEGMVGEGRHQLALVKLCESGSKRRVRDMESENEYLEVSGRSASKRARGSK